MKVMMIAHRSELGGAPKSMMDMVLNLKNKYGVEFILLLNKEGRLSQFCADNNIEYCIVGNEPICLAKGSTLIRRIVKFILRLYYVPKCWVGNYNAVKIVNRKIDMSEVDLIHTNSNRDGLGAILAQKYQKKHIWHIREYGIEDYDLFFVPPYNIDYMNRTTERFLFISDALKNSWIQRGIAEEKSCRVYNGINIDSIISDSERKLFSDDKLRMVFTGTICSNKGQYQAIEAIGLLPESYKKHITLDFIGEGPKEYIKFLKKRISELNIGEQVRFLGYSDHVGDMLCNYNIGLVCSKAEAFGRITAEYMAAGLIVIGSDTGANPEIIRNHGFLYRYGDISDFADKIKAIADTSMKNRIAMSYNCEHYVREHFTAMINAHNVYQQYVELRSDLQ